MAEKLCTLRTKGGGGGATYTETVLWQNPSPSSDFAAQTVTLSDDMNNYDYLKVSYRNHPTTDGVNDPFSVLISVSDFKTSLSGNSTRHNAFTYGGMYAPTNTTWTRFMFYDTDTTAKFSAVNQIGGTGSGNANAIPLQIVGIKKGGSGTKAKTVHGTGTMSTSTTTKVSLNFRPDFVVLECTKGTAEVRLVYDSAYGSSIQRLCSISSGGTAQYVKDSYPPTSTTGTRISLIENDGFTITKLSRGNYEAYGADFSYIAGKYEV